MTTIRCILDETACISKHQPGIIQGERIILYSEWNDLASAVADRLRQAGVRPGDRVALFMAADWRLLVLITGIMRAGAVACPVSTRLPRETVLQQLKQLGCATIVAYLDAARADTLPGISVLSPDLLLATPDVSARDVPRFNPDAPALMIFTSGTSGTPRPAVLSYGNLYYNAQGANVNIRLHSNDRWLLNLPMYHVSGMGILFRCMLAGASVVIPDARESLLQSLLRYRPSHVSVVPSQVSELLGDAESSHITGVRVFLVGGSSADPLMLEQCRKIQWPVYLTYGMTETGSQIATMPADAPPEKRMSTCGKILRHRKISISPEGEILVRGPCLFLGYWESGNIELPLDPEGWFHTGDLGQIDPDGYLQIAGRMDFLIISGGENIQPEEVENCLLQMVGVERALVVPKAHPKYGQRPVAFVKADVIKKKEWTESMARKIAPFKIPDEFYPWPEELAGSNLKPSRKQFAQYAATISGKS